MGGSGGKVLMDNADLVSSRVATAYNAVVVKHQENKLT